MATIARQTEPWRRRLYLPAYSVADAARYAHSKPGTVSSWHFSTAKVGPALPGRERRAQLSYMELVEVAFVATFRSHGVSLQRIRAAREYLAQTLQAEYPFATYRLKTEGHHILMDLKDLDRDTEVGTLVCLDKHGQLGWQDVISERFEQFDYEHDLAIRWFPEGKKSSIVIDPRVSFGAPAVKGIATWALKARFEAGETVKEIAEDFCLDHKQVMAALEFEGVNLAA